MPSLCSIASAAGAVVLGLLAQQSRADDTYPNCPDPDWTCSAYGVDIQGGGTYFENIDSDADFTFASQFRECQPTFAYNVLVDPFGDQLICSNTTLTPDNTTVTSTCPVEKSNLTSGDYSVILFSNNGDCAPFNVERHFVLSVGEQVTSTITPLVIFTSTTTPIKTVVTTSTTTTEYYLSASTITTSKSAVNPTRTVTPKAFTTTFTTTASTKTLTRYDLEVYQNLVTSTARCTISKAQVTADPPATQTVTLSGALAAQATSSAAPGASGAALMARYPVDLDMEDIVGDKASFLARRAAWLDSAEEFAGAKRDVDQSVIYVVQTNASDFSTSTNTITATTVTYTTTSLVAKTTTSTPPAVILYLNQVTTVTATTATVSKTRTIKMATTYVTATKFATVKVTTTVTPAVKAASCSASGGYMQ